MTLRTTALADLATLYDASLGFAETATSITNSINGHFFEEFEQNEDSDFAPVDDSRPIFRIRASDESLIINDLMTIRSTNYQVIQRRPNGEFEIDLQLHRL